MYAPSEHQVKSKLAFHVALLSPGGEAVEPLAAYAEPALFSALGTTLPPGAALTGLDADARDANGRPAMCVRVGIDSVAALAAVRSDVLSGDFDERLSAALREVPRADGEAFVPREGETLRIEGLYQKPSLNGSEGELLSRDAASGRLAVRLHDGAQLLIRPSNVAPPHLAACADDRHSSRVNLITRHWAGLGWKGLVEA